MLGEVVETNPGNRKIQFVNTFVLFCSIYVYGWSQVLLNIWREHAGPKPIKRFSVNMDIDGVYSEEGVQK